ncbi:MAG: TetR/AcrR family transcriptional regulator [Ignavibacteriales bacterium]|nr:TetR/AcrR family transcriptional regulator [Ignavibacteriales bacterium]
MLEEKNIEHRILEVASEIFFQSGFNRVRMDKISNQIGIDKKIIYKYYISKDQLVERILEDNMLAALYRYKKIMDSSEEYAIKLFHILSLMGKTLASMGILFLDDLRKYRPDLWHKLEDIRSQTLLMSITEFLEDGIRLGIVRGDLRKEILIIAYFGTMESVLRSKEISVNSFSSDEAINLITHILVDGLLSVQEQGRWNNKNLITSN